MPFLTLLLALLLLLLLLRLLDAQPGWPPRTC